MRNRFPLARPAWAATPALARPLAALGLLLATAGAAQAQTTTNFAYTGGTQSYTVPAGITKLNVVATGGGGGGNRGNNRGGLGAVVQATVTVVPGEVLTVVVGGRGVDSNSNGGQGVSGGGAGGYNGGGTGAYTGGGGGGATDLRRATASGSTGDYFTSRNALLVAGGGGAADSGPAGGDAGTPNGGNGVSGQGGPAGQGATTTALGGGYLGSNGTGGNANPNNFNAAGGGGYYGGGGGGGAAGTFGTGLNGGGGGSSYVLPTGSSNVSYSLAASRTDGALAITTVPTPTNNALAFDGSNDYVSLGSPAAVSNLGPGGYTLEAWVYYDGRSGASSIIRKTGDYNLYINNGVLGAEVWPQGGGNAAWRVATGSTSLAANRWNHVAATWTPATSTFAFYVNGVADPVTNSNTGSVSGSEGLALGASTIYGNYLGGRLDELRIYNTALTATQIQADMFSTTAAVPGSLKYYANFDQGTAGGNNAGLTSLTDQSGNGSTGTLNNFALTGTSSNFVRSFPTITGITPTTGNTGSSVTLTGTNLTDATGFAFNGTGAVQTTPTNDLTTTFAVPGGATTGPVSVFSAALTRYNGPIFTVTGASASTNNALAFDGSNDYVAFGATPAASNLGPGGLTLEAWVYYDGNTGVNSIIRKTGDYNLYLNSGKLSAEVWPQGTSSTSWRIINGSVVVPANRWTHVAATWNPTSASFLLYVNGTQDGAATGSTNSISGSENLTLGKSTIYGNLLTGRLDEVRIYKAALTAAQVQADMFSTSSAVPASQVAYFNFDEGTAGGNNAGVTSLADQSGNNYTGTLNNFDLTGTSSNWVRSFPTITGISPTTGKSGTSVTVTGTNLTDATSFAFNGTSTTNFTTPTSDLTATITAPVGVTTGPVSVASATLTKYNGPVFTLVNDLVVTTTQSIPGDSYSSITVNNPGVGTLAGNVTVSGSTTINSGGTLNDGCNILSGPGSFTLAAGGTLGICAAAGISSSGATGAIQNTGTRSFASDASYVYNGTAAQVTGSGLPAQVRNLTTTNGNAVTLSQATSVAQVLTVGGSGNLATGGNTLTLLSSSAGTALVVNSGAGVVQGTATVQRYIDASGNAGTSGYRHYSAPVSGMAFGALATTSTGGSFAPVVGSTNYNTAANTFTVMPYPNVYGYDQSRVGSTTLATNLTAFDQGYYSPTSSTLAVGQGYTVQIGNGEKINFAGTLNTGTQTIGSLQRNANAAGGWQLIGNPYPSPLDWGTVGASGTGSSLTGVDPAAYVFQSTSGYAGRYTSFNNGVGAGSALLATGQGFFVRTSSSTAPGTVTLTNANRVTSYAASPKFQRTAETRPLVRLSLATGSQPVTMAAAQDETFVYFESGATGDFDGRFDAYKLPNPSGLYLGTAALVPSGALPTGLSIDGRAPLAAGSTLSVPVWPSAVAGTYTLTATQLLNFAGMGNGTRVLLLDALTGTATDLAATPSYTFTVAPSAPATGRFTLSFGQATPLATTSAALAQVQASLYPNPTAGATTLSLAGLPADAYQVRATLSDALGRSIGRVLLTPARGAASAQLPTQGLAGGVYVLRLETLGTQGQLLGQLPAQRLSVR